MNVAELIAALQKMPADFPAVYYVPECDCTSDEDYAVDTVEIIGQRTKSVRLA